MVKALSKKQRSERMREIVAKRWKKIPKKERSEISKRMLDARYKDKREQNNNGPTKSNEVKPKGKTDNAKPERGEGKGSR